MGDVGFVVNPVAGAHDAGRGHPERPARVAAILEHLDRGGVLDDLDVVEAEPAPLSVADGTHSAEHLGRLAALDRAGGGRIDADTAMGDRSLEAALHGTQGTIVAAERVLAGSWDAAFVCTRPPGHHATAETPMGFCLINHVAVAARRVASTGRRVAIVDWDAHHGNGTQDIFWDDPDVLYVSLHQYPWYPGTGDPTERGGAGASGTTMNVALPAGTGEDVYERALTELIAPAVTAFAPDLIFVSAGFDAHHLDPLCMMRLTAGAFHRFAVTVASWGPGPVCVLEGGYDLDALRWSTEATMAGLCGREPDRLADREADRTTSPSESQAWLERASEIITAP